VKKESLAGTTSVVGDVQARTDSGKNCHAPRPRGYGRKVKDGCKNVRKQGVEHAPTGILARVLRRAKRNAGGGKIAWTAQPIGEAELRNVYGSFRRGTEKS